MSAESERVSPSPSPSAAPRYPIVSDSSPIWLRGSPWGLQDNHEDSSKDIWTTEKEGQHWGECRDMLKSHDAKVLDDWRDDINTQLLVSSLLAAVTGGFVVESQKRLSEDPAVTSAVVLLQIARQLNESIALSATRFMAFDGPSHVERAFNSLFYASLGLSIANVIIGLLCLQWIRGLAREPPGMTSDSYPSLRYTRYLGFEIWGAKAIISSLPLLLLAALLAFFAGLLVLASDSDWVASIPLYIILPSVLAIVLFTTFVPGLVIVLNTAFRKGSDFPSLPPFRSLQSWIAMQGFIWIFQATSGVFKLNPFGAFPPLRRCLDWGQIDRLWSGWSHITANDVYRFPLILSTGTVKDLNTISNIIEELWQIDTSMPELRKMTVLVAVFLLYGRSLPETTYGSIVGLFLDELVGLINVGVSLDTFSFPFDVEEMISLEFAPVDSIRHLVNSLSFLCRTGGPLNEALWNLFWKALADEIQGTSMESSHIGPIIFNDALNSMKLALENPSTDKQTVFRRGFKTFIKVATYQIEHERPWVKSTSTRSAALCTIAWHPIWDLAKEIIATLPPGEHTTAAEMSMMTFDRIRQKIPPRTAPTPPMEPSTPPDGLMTEEPQSYTTSPHIALDIDPEDDGDDDVRSAVVASADAPSVTEREEDEDAEEEVGGTEEEIASDQEQPVTAMASSFALPTTPIDSSKSPPGPPRLR